MSITMSAKSFSLSSPSVWNSLPHSCRSTKTVTAFKLALNSELFAIAYGSHYRPSFPLHAIPIRPRLMALYKCALIDWLPSYERCWMRPVLYRWRRTQHGFGIAGETATKLTYAVGTTTIRLRFDGRSTAYQRSLRSQWRNPIAPVTLTYLFIMPPPPRRGH